MPVLADPSTEVAVNSLPPQTVALARKHIQSLVSNTADPERDWVDAALAPVARYIDEPGNHQGTVPAYAEFRVVGAKSPQEPKGYILVSLTEEDYPVPEFSTRGTPKTDRLMLTKDAGTVHRFMRFGPAYFVGEDATGNQLCGLGRAPLKVTGPLPPGRVIEGGSDAGAVGVLGVNGRNTAPSANYQEMKADFQSHPLRLQSRALRSKNTAAVWRMANGIHNPPLPLHVGQTSDFLPGKSFSSAAVAAAGPIEIVRLFPLPAGGLRVTGVAAGSVVAKVVEKNGAVDYQTITVSAPSTAPISARDQPFQTVDWIAGTDWDGDQRQFDQLMRPE